MKMICFIVFIFFSLQPYAFLANADISNSLAIEKNTQAIEDLFHQNKEQLPADYLRAVSSEIIEQRAHYSNNTIAKVFILLADLAYNQSDSERFSQFAHDGLMLTTIDFSLKLNLLLKVASGYYAKGHYHKILTVSNEAITLAQSSGNTKYHLLALAYRSIGYALINNYPEAFNDLINVESLIERNQTFSDNIDILEIISIANYYLDDYQTMLMINQKILKLRFNLSLKSHLVRTYYHIGIAYHRLGLFDEAYNAYWETKQYAKDKSSKVDLAYAELGLGEILLLQKNHQTSYSALIRAEQLFKESNLPKPYLSTLIALSKSSLFIGREAYAYQLLKQAEKMIPGMELTNEQIELYLLLSAMYQSKKNHPKALELLNRYVQSNKHFIDKKLSNILLRAGHIPEQDIKRQLMSELAKKSELYSAFYKKYQQQKLMLITLVMVLSFIIFFIIIYALRQRSKKINIAYDEVEKPLYFLESSIKTKQMYQSAYKQARKYNYPITIGYISIDNLQELVFRFNKKIFNEVSKTIATLINKHLGEFDHAGLINEGEYLLLFPHQTSRTIEKDFDDLKEALNVTFFANLGRFTVNIHFALDTPSVQDIDPYIFLSKLSDTAAIAGSSVEYSSNKVAM